MLVGYWEEVAGARICPLVEFTLVLLCFFLAVVLPSVAAFAGVIAGTAPDATANIASVKRRIASLVMRFSCRSAEKPSGAR